MPLRGRGYFNYHIAKNIGPKKAREVERKLGLTPNWLDSATHDLAPESIELAREFQGLSAADREAILRHVKALKKR